MLVGLCSCTQVPAGTPSITSNPEAICTIGGEVVKAFEFGIRDIPIYGSTVEVVGMVMMV